MGINSAPSNVHRKDLISTSLPRTMDGVRGVLSALAKDSGKQLKTGLSQRSGNNVGDYVAEGSHHHMDDIRNVVVTFCPAWLYQSLVMPNHLTVTKKWGEAMR